MISVREEAKRLRSVEFDHPFRVGISGAVHFDTGGSHYAPEVYHDDSTDVDILSDKWQAFSSGYSGQHGYSGPVMHASELFSGRLLDDVLSTPGVYVLTTVEVLPDDDDPDPFPAGWIVLQYREES